MQTQISASEETVWSESSLFANLTSILGIPALKTNIYLNTEIGKCSKF